MTCPAVPSPEPGRIDRLIRKWRRGRYAVAASFIAWPIAASRRRVWINGLPHNRNPPILADIDPPISKRKVGAVWNWSGSFVERAINFRRHTFSARHPLSESVSRSLRERPFARSLNLRDPTAVWSRKLSWIKIDWAFSVLRKEDSRWSEY